MRTEADIRQALDFDSDPAALDRLMSFAGDLDDGGLGQNRLGQNDLHITARPGRTPRPLLLPLLAAAAVVVTVGAGVAVAELQHPSRTASGRGDQLTAAQRRPTWNLRIAPLTGYTVTRVSASSIGLATGSLFTIHATSRTRPEQGGITTCPGRSLAACTGPLGHRQPVSVNGQPGAFRPGRHVRQGALTAAQYRQHPWSAARQADNPPELSWYAGDHTVIDLWGTFGYNPKTHDFDNTAARKILLRIAAATTAGHHDAAQLPFALSNLPGRVAPESVIIGRGACSDYGTGPVSRHDALGVVFTACRLPTAASRSAQIRAATHVEFTQSGNVLDFRHDVIVVHDFPDSTSLFIAIETDGPANMTRAQAERIAAHADVSPDLHDRSTWLTVP